ncbi:MAG: peptide deformylase [Rhodobacteraceae bacterium]|nr:peptide deformylase [Paracoccaceae bacterium]
MALRPIARMGAEVLKDRAAEIGDFTDPALGTLIDDMVETMFAANGVGLAAPQIFAPYRVVVFFVPAARNNGVEVPLTVMINPEINPTGPDKHSDWEACLSVPGLTGMVPRWTHIRYSWQDIRGHRHEREATDFHARVVQHECDHLDGKLYPMQMTDLTTLSYVETLKAEAMARGEELDIDEEGEPVAAHSLGSGDGSTAVDITRGDVEADRQS